MESERSTFEKNQQNLSRESENDYLQNKNKTDTGKNLFECYICMDTPNNPVATTCGHIFCWKCLQQWIGGRTELICPLCRNGLDVNRIIPLFSNSNSSSQERDDRPKVERIPPVRHNAFVSAKDSINFPHLVSKYFQGSWLLWN